MTLGTGQDRNLSQHISAEEYPETHLLIAVKLAIYTNHDTIQKE